MMDESANKCVKCGQDGHQTEVWAVSRRCLCLVQLDIPQADRSRSQTKQIRLAK